MDLMTLKVIENWDVIIKSTDNV